MECGGGRWGVGGGWGVGGRGVMVSDPQATMQGLLLAASSSSPGQR